MPLPLPSNALFSVNEKRLKEFNNQKQSFSYHLFLMFERNRTWKLPLEVCKILEMFLVHEEHCVSISQIQSHMDFILESLALLRIGRHWYLEDFHWHPLLREWTRLIV